MCVWYSCVRRGSKYFKVVSDWLTLVADLYGTILVGRPLWTQFDDIVVLAVVFVALLSRSIRFQIFGNLKDICLMMGEVSLETSPKNIMIQDTINSENSMYTTESTNTNIFKSRLVDHWISCDQNLKVICWGGCFTFF